MATEDTKGNLHDERGVGGKFCKGMPQQKAHDLTNKTYNYTTAIIEWRKANGKDKKHS